MSPSRETVFVVDDDPIMRKSLSRLLGSAGYDVVTFAGPEDFLRLVPPDSSGCAILDVSMPGLDGLALQRELSSRGNDLPVVFLTGHGDIPKSVQAMKGGATDFFAKPVEEDVLLQAVRRALDTNRSVRRGREELADLQRRLDTLTPREREVLDLVVAGRLNKQIAADLGIAEGTVKIHRGRVMEKLQAGSVAELVRLADRERGARAAPGRLTPSRPHITKVE